MRKEKIFDFEGILPPREDPTPSNKNAAILRFMDIEDADLPLPMPMTLGMQEKMPPLQMQSQMFLAPPPPLEAVKKEPRRSRSPIRSLHSRCSSSRPSLSRRDCEEELQKRINDACKYFPGVGELYLSILEKISTIDSKKPENDEILETMNDRDIPIILKDSTEGKFLFLCEDVGLDLLREVAEENKNAAEAEERGNELPMMEEEKIDVDGRAAGEDSDDLGGEGSLETYKDGSDESLNGDNRREHRERSTSQRSQQSRSSKQVRFSSALQHLRYESSDDEGLDMLPPPLPKPGLTKRKSQN
eukprot:TRINITY_DN5265_c0_g1_i4.p1 TRINITY_DN5265_c0_g1~~TRINITY_DN5265_c0_g1_i4.p1  ORF type:complete len:302 (+),score=70.37 TRINITY_DN5265_c0_g1_i4:172-1077(+)